MNYENKLYNNTVTLLFDARKHRYTWEEKDVAVKSVTTALKIINKPALVPWAANAAVDCIAEKLEPGIEYDELEIAEMLNQARNAHYKKKTTAGDLGTLLHKWIEDFIKGNDPGLPKNELLRKSVKRFLGWVEQHKVKFLLSEQVIFSKKYQYCGTTDFICKIDGKLYVGDLKTSTGVYSEMLVQTSAYRFAREEEFPKEKYEGMIILRIGSDGTFETAIVRGQKIYENLFRTFIYALSLSNEMEFVDAYRPERTL